MDYYSNYLNLPAIFINEVIGSFWLSLFLLVGLVVYICTKYKVPQDITGMMVVLAILAMFAFDTGQIILIILMILWGVGIGYYVVSKAMNR